jgi:hypothetical protein
MSGALISAPTNGDTNWSNFVSIVQKTYRQFNFASLTNTTSTGLPAIEAGSYTSINGAMYSLTPATGGNEAITGATGISGGSELYIKATVAGSSVSCSFTTTPPAWSQAKGGYFDGDDKYIGGCYKSTGGRYQTKFVYGDKLPEDQIRPYIEASSPIGVWNMDGSEGVSVSNTLYSFTRIKDVTILINPDTGTKNHSLVGSSGSRFGGGYAIRASTLLYLVRYGSTDGIYDNTYFNSTTIDRGNVYFTIKA